MTTADRTGDRGIELPTVTGFDEQQVDGTLTQVVSFFVLVGDDLPIWYRLWAGSGLLRCADGGASFEQVIDAGAFAVAGKLLRGHKRPAPSRRWPVTMCGILLPRKRLGPHRAGRTGR